MPNLFESWRIYPKFYSWFYFNIFMKCEFSWLLSLFFLFHLAQLLFVILSSFLLKFFNIYYFWIQPLNTLVHILDPSPCILLLSIRIMWVLIVNFRFGLVDGFNMEGIRDALGCARLDLFYIWLLFYFYYKLL